MSSLLHFLGSSFSRGLGLGLMVKGRVEGLQVHGSGRDKPRDAGLQRRRRSHPVNRPGSKTPRENTEAARNTKPLNPQP